MSFVKVIQDMIDIALPTTTPDPLPTIPIGKIETFRTRQTTSNLFPYWNLSLPDQTLLRANYPDYVDYLRSIKIEMCAINPLIGTAQLPGTQYITFSNSQNLTPGSTLYFQASNKFVEVSNGSGTNYLSNEVHSIGSQGVALVDPSNYVSSFSGTWSGNSFTLTNNPQNTVLMSALVEDAIAAGANSFSTSINPPSDWMILRWGNTDAYITGFSHTNKIITVSGPTPTGTSVEFYPYRTLLSTEARHRQVDDSALMNGGMEIVTGLRSRDQTGTHSHSAGGNITSNFAMIVYEGGGGEAVGGGGLRTRYAQDFMNLNLSVGEQNSGRVSQFTRPRRLGVYFYEYMGRVL